MAESSIEWTDFTWNPIRARRLDTGKVGWHCERVSPACTNCYAAAMNHRNLPNGGTGLDYVRTARDKVEIFVDPKTLMQPLRWKKSRKVFDCSMTDLFGEFVPFGLVDMVFAVMALCPQHTFQVLTKRPERMAEYLTHLQKAADDHAPNTGTLGFTPVNVLNIRWLHARRLGGPASGYTTAGPAIDKDVPWPLPNVWLGATVENQEWADKRIPHLLKCPAAVRFLSVEPMLGGVSLSQAVPCGDCGEYDDESGCRYGGDCIDHNWWARSGIHWVICGGESGRNSRPMHPEWVRSLRNECSAAGVPFFFKQHGEWLPWDDASLYDRGAKPVHNFEDNRCVRVGKKAAGRLLDGVEHSEFPSPVPV